ncbi:PQQ-binding-like beta-propeller repeat protein [Kitasatospora sp. NPDC056531]|uniref:outer membrane protein assembly factor BamB family protein n=1 Tax=Kitasatospora sp. NPDC056531 TaxID=3345856 RepID=UPI00369456B0
MAVDPRDCGGGGPQARRLFPLSWDTDRIDHLSGGPALRLTGESGEALVHAGRIYNSRPLRHGRVYIIRRGYPDGALQWLFTTDHPATALDTDGDTVFAALTSGEVVALDAASGTLRWRTLLTVDGIPTVVLSLTVADPGHLLLGTVDGRILVADPQLQSNPGS